MSMYKLLHGFTVINLVYNNNSNSDNNIFIKFKKLKYKFKLQ